MINKIKKIITEEKEITVSITCDICGKTYQTYNDEDGAINDVFEIQEFTHIRMTGGYGSIFGDGDSIECDICQHCLKKKLGEYIRIISENHMVGGSDFDTVN